MFNLRPQKYFSWHGLHNSSSCCTFPVAAAYTPLESSSLSVHTNFGSDNLI